MAVRACRTRRVYEPHADDDGVRVLVDRLWPRGISRDKGRIDVWLKDVAPSDALRKTFHGNPERWSEFVDAYRAELAREPARSAASELRKMIAKGPVTLLFASKDGERNNAVALKQVLKSK